MAAEKRCAYGDIECFNMVAPVFRGRLTVDRSTRQADVISIPISVLDCCIRMINDTFK